MSLLFNMLSRFIIAFIPKSKCLNFMAAVTACIDFGAPPPQKNKQTNKQKPVNVSTVSPSICHEVMGSDAMIFLCWKLSFKPAFHSFFHPYQEALYFLFTLCHYRGITCISEAVDISLGNLDFSLWFIHHSISHDVVCMVCSASLFCPESKQKISSKKAGEVMIRKKEEREGPSPFNQSRCPAWSRSKLFRNRIIND